MRCMDRPFCTANDIKYLNVIPLITGEYVSSKSMLGLCVNPCATSLALYLTIALFSFLLRMKNSFRSHMECVSRSRHYCGKYLSFLECNSTSIASFHLIQLD